MSPETWSNILYTYGPFALLVFLVIVIERKVRLASNDPKKDNPTDQRFFRRLYGLVWILIFATIICCIFFWWQINLSRRPQITGTIENLTNTQMVGTTCADLFLHKKPKPGSYSDYDFLLINKENKPWPDGTKVRFTIQTRKRNSIEEDVYEYSLSILSDFYKSGVVLRQREDKKLFLYHNGQAKEELVGELLPDDAWASNEAIKVNEKPSWSLIPTAHAQTSQQSFSGYEFAVGLESPDAIVRRKTRYELSRQDQKLALPWINSVLKDTASSPRLRLGVLVALNNMPNLAGQSLLPETIEAIQNTLNNSDDALRNEALELANRYSLNPVTIYEHDNFDGKGQVYGPGTFRYDLGGLGSLPNDSASSVRVAKGFRVRLCENEGNGKGGGLCEILGSGDYRLGWGPKSLGDKVSFIEVWKE